jgi:heat shock protein HslJ
MAECASGSSFGLSRAGEFNTAAQAYMNIPHFFGKPVLVSMLGSMVEEDGVEVIRIEQFNRFYPNRDCEGAQTGAVLTGTYWRLIELDGIALALEENQAAPYLIFDPDKSMTGFGGCNDIAGSFLVQGDVFLINRAGGARIACPGGMEVENALLEALDSTEVYRIEGDVFELVDQFNTTRAKFRAGP